MANLRVKSGATGAADGSSWADAYTTISSAIFARSIGDPVWVSNNHAEDTSASVFLAFNTSTLAIPDVIVCVDDSSDPPTAGAIGARVVTTGAYGVSATSGAGATIQGIEFEIGVGATTAANLTVGGASKALYHFKDCKISLKSTYDQGAITLGSPSLNDPQKVVWENVDISFVHAGQGFIINNEFFWRGGSILPTSVATDSLFRVVGGSLTGVRINLDGVDLSAMSTTSTLVAQLSSTTFLEEILIQNCKLPSGWGGTFMAGSLDAGRRGSMYNCDGGDTNYRIWIEDWAGTIRDETTIVRTGGASDGTTPLAWKMTSNANAIPTTTPLRADPITMWNTGIGSPVTLDIEILSDNTVALTEADVWVEVMHPGSSGSPLRLRIDDANLTTVGTPAAQTASTVEWTTTGLTNPNKQRLSVTFTPQEVGPISAVVCLGKASTTIYVDCEFTLS